MDQTCKCGNTINHPKVYHKSEYSHWGWFLLTILGLSARPICVKFICGECEKTIMIANDKYTLSKYVGR